MVLEALRQSQWKEIWKSTVIYLKLLTFYSNEYGNLPKHRNYDKNKQSRYFV